DRKGHRGTPGYAAPEVVRGEALSVASDLYSLGATLFVMAMTVARGQPPGRSPLMKAPKDAATAAGALEEAAVPAALSQLATGPLAPSPASRRTSAREVRDELARLHASARQPLIERTRADVLVGRNRELARIERWWALAPRGTPLLLLEGE